MKLPAAVWCFVAVGFVAGGFALLTNHTPAAADTRSKVDSAPEPVEESMHEFMEYVFQPTYQRLKAAMAAEPADKNGWKPIKADSLILAEGGNLLLFRTPAEDGKDWNDYSIAVRVAGGELYRAAQARDYQQAKTSYTAMLDQCNACHQQFAEGKYQLKP